MKDGMATYPKFSRQWTRTTWTLPLQFFVLCSSHALLIINNNNNTQLVTHHMSVNAYSYISERTESQPSLPMSQSLMSTTMDTAPKNLSFHRVATDP